MDFEQEVKTFAAQAKKEIASLAGETIALQFVLTQVFSELANGDARLRIVFKTAFDRAVNGVEDMAMKHGDEAAPEHLAKAIRIVEQMRTAVLGK